MPRSCAARRPGRSRTSVAGSLPIVVGVEHDEIGDTRLRRACRGRAGRTARPVSRSWRAPPTRATRAVGRAACRRGTASGTSRRTCGRGARRRRSRRGTRRGRPTACCRSAQWASSSSGALGHSTVRRSSAITMSTSVSNGSSSPRSAAMSRTTRPLSPSFAVAVGVADDVAAEVGEATEHAGLVAVRARHHHPTGRDVAELLDPLGHRGVHDRTPARA